MLTNAIFNKTANNNYNLLVSSFKTYKERWENGVREFDAPPCKREVTQRREKKGGQKSAAIKEGKKSNYAQKDAGAKARTVYVTPRKWPEKRRSDNKEISNAEKAAKIGEK